MCLHTPGNNTDDELKPFFQPDGSINESDDSVIIPEGVHHHVDNVLLNTDIYSEDGILGFVYESGNEEIIVYTSDEAEELCNNFEDEDEDSEPNPFSDSELSEAEIAHDIQLSKFYIEVSQQKVIADEEFVTDGSFDEEMYYEYIESSDTEIDSMPQNNVLK